MRKLDNLTKDRLVDLYITDRKSLEGMAKRKIYQQKTKNGLYYTIVYGHNG